MIFTFLYLYALLMMFPCFNFIQTEHVQRYDHCMSFENAKIVSRAKNYHEQLLLESCYSQVDASSGNDHIDIPDIYKCLMH